MNNSEKAKLLDFINTIPNNANAVYVKKQITAFIHNQPDKLKPWKSVFGRIAFVLSMVLCAIGIWIISDHLNIQVSNGARPISKSDVFIYCFLAIAPPAWFLLEYVWFFPDRLKLDSNELADLKYTHELAGKVWAGVVVVVTAILWLKYRSGGPFIGHS